MKNERGEKRLNKNRIRNKFVSILISSDVLEMRELQKNRRSPRTLQESTVVGDYINTMKTTFDFNFDLYQAFKHRGYT